MNNIQKIQHLIITKGINKEVILIKQANTIQKQKINRKVSYPIVHYALFMAGVPIFSGTPSLSLPLSRSMGMTLIAPSHDYDPRKRGARGER